MAVRSSIRNPKPRWSLNDLCPELLALIVEQLHEIDSRSTALVRCVCRRLNAIATPIAYRELVLNERIVADDAEREYPDAFQHIYAYTHHVAARSNLDPDGIRRILERAQRVQSVRWRYIPLDFSDGPFWLPSDVLGQGQIQDKGIRLHVEGLPLLSSKEKYQDFYLKSIPSDLLVSLELAHPIPPLTTRLHSLKELLLASPHLETLHYRDKGQGTHFSFTGSERLPPLKDLVLESYDWNHDKHSVATHWDFSRIRSLALLSVPIHSFLTSVPPTSLAALHTLHASDFSAHHHHHHHHPGPPDHRLSATLDLAALVSTHIRALVDLRLTCHVSHFPPSALLRHAASLRRLSLRDHVGFADDDRRCPTLPASDLEVLAGALDRLTALELDMDFDDDDDHHQQRRRFLQALCHFPALRTLTLHTQTVLRPAGCDDDDDDDDVPAAAVAAADADPDRDAAARTFAFLVRNRGAGVGGGDVPVPWQRVTLNVGTGGAVTRRVGEGWRGLVAERCFVLERADGSGGGGGGGFVFREEGGGRV